MQQPSNGFTQTHNVDISKEKQGCREICGKVLYKSQVGQSKGAQLFNLPVGKPEKQYFRDLTRNVMMRAMILNKKQSKTGK